MCWEYFKSMDSNPTITSPKQYSFDWSLRAMFHQELVRLVFEGNVPPTAFQFKWLRALQKGAISKNCPGECPSSRLFCHIHPLYIVSRLGRRRQGGKAFHLGYCPRPSILSVMGGSTTTSQRGIRKGGFLAPIAFPVLKKREYIPSIDCHPKSIPPNQLQGQRRSGNCCWKSRQKLQSRSGKPIGRYRTTRP
jgi:hypothetical protein